MEECFSCTECCKRYRITLLPEEVENISHFLKISKKEFLNKFCELEEINNTLFFVLKKYKDHCIFLSKDGKCEIYKVRPLQCKIFPNLGIKFSFCRIQKKIFVDPLACIALEKYKSYVKNAKNEIQKLFS